MIKYIRITNFDTVENHVLSHPDKPYETQDFIYWLEYYRRCAAPKRKAKKNRSNHLKEKDDLVT